MRGEKNEKKCIKSINTGIKHKKSRKKKVFPVLNDTKYFTTKLGQQIL